MQSARCKAACAVTTSGLTRLVYGQHVAVSGRLVEPAIFDGFSYKDYLAIKGVGSVLYDANVASCSTAASTATRSCMNSMRCAPAARR